MSTLQMSIKNIDVTTKRDTQTITSTSAKPWSILDDLALDRLPRPDDFATLEPNFTLLDGSMREFPDNTDNMTWGFFSGEMSGPDGFYLNPPKLRIPFSSPHKSRGITLFYYADCGYTVRVTWYSDIYGTEIIKSGEYETEKITGVVRETVSGYRSIDVEFIKSSIPFRFVKWWAVEYGLIRIILDNEINKCNILEEIDPTSESISVNILRANIRSRNSFISPISSPDFDDMLMEQQMLTIERNGAPFGVFFLEEWEDVNQDGIEFDISAGDAMSILDLYPHMGGMYYNKSVVALFDEIFERCFPTGNVTYILDPAFADATVTGWIPIGMCGFAFQHICFALNATANAARIGDIRVYPREIDIKTDGTPTSTDKQPWVDMNDLKSYVPPRYVPTLEPNYALLDGQTDEFPDEKGTLNLGWVSKSMSDERGIFTTPPPLIIPFTTNHNLRELILDFGAYENEYIKRLRLILLDEFDNEVYNNEYKFTQNPAIITDKIFGYRRMIIEALEMSAPFRFAKISSMNFGRSFYIPLEKQYRRGRDRPTSFISGVRVVSHSYVETDNEMEIFNDFLLYGFNDVFEFPEPLHSVTVQGAEIIDIGANFVRIKVTNEAFHFANGISEVVIKGKRYIDNKLFHNVNAEIEPGRIEKIKLYENYTLINPQIGDERARELFEHLRLPINSSTEIVLDETEVALMAQVQTRGNDVVGVVQKLDINLRANRAQMEVVGSVVD